MGVRGGGWTVCVAVAAVAATACMTEYHVQLRLTSPPAATCYEACRRSNAEPAECVERCPGAARVDKCRPATREAVCVSGDELGWGRTLGVAVLAYLALVVAVANIEGSTI